jgi:hypothetical protein
MAQSNLAGLIGRPLNRVDGPVLPENHIRA